MDSPLSAQVGEHGEDATVGIGTRGKVELLEGLFDVCLDGALGDDEALRDRVVGQTFGEQFEDLALARGEAGRAAEYPRGW